MNGRRYSTRLLVYFGLLVMTASLLGVAWLVHAEVRADVAPRGETVETKVICFGHADVEEGVASLYPLQPGQVDRVHVKEGQAVKAGDVLVSLDKRLADCLLRQARAALREAEIQHHQSHKLVQQQSLKEAEQAAVLDALAAKIRAAESLRARREELRGLQTNEKELDAARAQCAELRAMLRGEEKKLEELRLNEPRDAIDRAEVDVQAKRAKLDQAELALEQCDLKAPGDGTILRIFVHAGEVLTNMPKQPAISFCPNAPRIVRAEVDQEFAHRVAVGQAALVQDDGGATAGWTGRVYRISDWYTHRRSILQDPLQLNDVRTLECLISLDPGHSPPRIGQRLLVTLQAR